MGAKSVLSGLVALGLLAGGGYALSRVLDERPAFPLTSQCEAAGETVVMLQADQMAHAATISAVGLRRSVPERAITVALATALQESKLRNLPGGDRDSVGLFQQRPSQGWGDPKQLQDPRYAARAFYRHLVKVRGWKRMRITDAAQAVQKSAHPDAYQRWADEAESLTAALTGSVPGSLSCTLSGDAERRGERAAAALGEAIKADWGEVDAVPPAEGHGVELTVADDRSGWRLAHWLVAHAAQHGIREVRYGDRTWSAEDGSWKRVRGAEAGERGPATVIAQLSGDASAER
ncbi:MAG: hypothetical protein GEU94_15910 [Micromonosporaceae bacterium]|nr:hypothetical protein [Micromonosporaceae bacterium]